MLKVLGLALFMFLPQLSFANDFLRSGKQLLVCENKEMIFRINWEDWDIEKSYAIRTKNNSTKFSLRINRDDAESLYQIDSDFEKYEDGKVTGASSLIFSIGPELDESNFQEKDIRLHYVDKDKLDADLKKVCKN